MILVCCLITTVAFAGEDPQIKDFTRKAYLLEDTEVAKIKEEIRTRCNLLPAEEATYPWYYHYELGIAMQKRNDWQRSLDSMLTALDFRDRPQKSSRIYGMWFIDYYPYYNIGLAHHRLGNWKCAVQSFRLSRMLEDIPADSTASLQLRLYGAEAEEKLEKKLPED